MLSVALVTLTTHDVFAPPGVSVAPESVQVPDTLVHVSAPVPDPPLAVSVRSSPYVALVDVTVRTAWVAFTGVTANDDDVTAR